MLHFVHCVISRIRKTANFELSDENVRKIKENTSFLVSLPRRNNINYALSKLKIHHPFCSVYLLDAFDIADPGCMQDVCHT